MRYNDAGPEYFVDNDELIVTIAVGADPLLRDYSTLTNDPRNFSTTLDCGLRTLTVPTVRH